MTDRKVTAACPASFLELLVYMAMDEIHYRDATEAGQTRCLDCRHSSKKGGQAWCREIGRQVRERGEDIKAFPVGPGKTCDEAKPRTKKETT